MEVTIYHEINDTFVIIINSNTYKLTINDVINHINKLSNISDIALVQIQIKIEFDFLAFLENLENYTELPAHRLLEHLRESKPMQLLNKSLILN